MQKLLMMSTNDGCIFNAPVSELIQEALANKEINRITIGYHLANLYLVDDSFYLRFRTDFPDFHLHPLLVSFIQSNIGKIILVGDFSNNIYSLKRIEQILNFLTLVNNGTENTAAYGQIFG
jgi:hypothetical protein